MDSQAPCVQLVNTALQVTDLSTHRKRGSSPPKIKNHISLLPVVLFIPLDCFCIGPNVRFTNLPQAALNCFSTSHIFEARLNVYFLTVDSFFFKFTLLSLILCTEPCFELLWGKSSVLNAKVGITYFKALKFIFLIHRLFSTKANINK